MADIRIKDLPTTATQTASDDFIALDGTVNGTRKIDASAPSFKTSVTSPSIVAPAATALTLTGGSTGASLVLGQGTTAGSATLTPTGTGQVVVSDTAGTVGLSLRSVAANTNNYAFRHGAVTGTIANALTVFNETTGARVLTIGPTGNLSVGASPSGGIGGVINATAAQPTLTISNSTAYNSSPVGFIQFLSAYNGSGGMDFSGGIKGGRENATDGDGKGFLSLWTNTSLSSPSEKARLTSTGNLLIGTTTDIAGSGGLFANSRVAIGSATDLYLTRTSAGTLQLNTTTGTIPFLVLNHVDNGGQAIISLKNPTQVWDIRNTGSSFAVREATLGNYPFEMDAGALSSGSVFINKTTAATSTTSGALRVAGGVGVSGAGYFGGLVSAGAGSSIGSATTVYRATNAGGDITSPFMVRNGGGTQFASHIYADATVVAQGFDAWNGTRLIEVANIQTSGVTTTAGAEVGGLSFAVKPAGGPASVRMILEGAAGNLNLNSTTSASSSTVGALTIGNGTAATNVAIGGGNVNAGGTLVSGNGATLTGGVTVLGTASVSQGYLSIKNATGAKEANLYNPAGGGLQIDTSGNGYPIVLNGSAVSLAPTGAVTIPGTTPSTSSTSGALQVAGGIYAGAASVFGSTVTCNNQVAISGAISPLLTTTNTSASSYATNRVVNSAGDILDTGIAGRSAGGVLQGYAYAYAFTQNGYRILTNNGTVAAGSYTYGEAYVSDATQAAGTSLGSAPTGGGAVKRGVYSDGSSWLLR